MNGIRKSSPPPVLPVPGQPQQRNFYQYSVPGSEEYQPSYSQSQQQFSLQPLGVQQPGYDVKSAGYGAPSATMQGPGIGHPQQPPVSMYQQPQQRPMGGANAPFYQPTNPNVQMRQRFPNPGTNQNMYPMAMNLSMYPAYPSSAGSIVVNPPMQPRMPSQPPYMGLQSTQSGMYTMPQQQQPLTSYNQNYNPPMYFNQQQQQQQQQRMQHAPPPKKVLKIINPNSGEDVMESVLQSHHVTPRPPSEPSPEAARTTPITEPPPAPSPQNEIAAQFAAQVAASLNPVHGGNNVAPHEAHPQQTMVSTQPPQTQPHFGAEAKGGPPAGVTANVNQPPPALPQDRKTPVAAPAAPSQPALANGNPPVSVDTSKPVLETVKATPAADKTVPAQSASEPVSVSVKSTPDTPSNVPATNTSGVSSRETTPQVNIVPPTPVEKFSPDAAEFKPEAQSKPSEPQEATAVKKEKPKKRAKELNKKGEKMQGSEFDAYTDSTPAENQTTEKPATKPSEEKSVEPEPVKEAPVTSAETKPAEVSQPPAEPSAPVKEPTPQRDAPEKPVSEPAKPATGARADSVPPEPAVAAPVSVDDGGVSGVSITVEGVADSEEPNEDGELEEGEIVDDEPDASMASLRYKYSEEQWSPLNLEGKKHYDREFLLQFQFDTTATSKPAGLPDIPDIVLDKPINAGRQFNREFSGGSSQSEFDFTPKYVWGGGQGGASKSRGLPRQPSNQKNKGQPPPRQINLSISKDIELHKAKEAWKPGRPDPKAEDTDADTQDLYKKTRSILNKLTPQKFQILLSQMQALKIDSESKLKGVIDLVFEKAISEPNFSVAYANMCRCLSMFRVQSDSKPGEMVNFRAVLLTRCQREFEKDKSSEDVFRTKREELDKTEESAKKEELKQELEYEESNAKRRSLGNIRFIGELFKLKMLTENIMHDCVFKLLRTKDPENLECLCRLLTTIGRELDTDKAKPRMEQYFQQMGKIANDKKNSSRVRFMLQDVIDLRLNKWVPRRVDNNPKTIDQIHKEVQQEAQEKLLQSQQNQLQSKSQGRGAGRRGPPGQGGQPDGWNTVGGPRTPLRSVDRSIDPSKMKFSKQNVDESIQLGPGGGAGKFASWTRGSNMGTAGRASMEKEKPNTPANRFQALSKPEEEGRRFGGTSPARGGDTPGRGRGGFGRPPMLSGRHSQESEREKALAAAKAIGGGSVSVEGVARERSRGRTDPRGNENLQSASSAPTPASTAKVLSADEMEKKTKAILDEYFQIHDIKEAITCVKELSADNHHHFVYNTLNHVLERSSQARKQAGHLLHDLVKQAIISVDNYVKGLSEVLEYAEDLEIDIPKIWQYYGELISPMVQDGSVPLSFFKQAAKPLLENNKAGVLLAEILHDASHREWETYRNEENGVNTNITYEQKLAEGHKKVAGLWSASGLHWSDFVPRNQVDQFLKDKDLEFTKGGDSVPTTPTTGLPVAEITEKLHDLVLVKRADNESVFDWIESNVDEPTTKRPAFIRALMTAVCNSAIKGDKGKEKLEPRDISSRSDLLQKYLDHQPDSELQALFALQTLITRLEHPPGLLRSMFDTLYDDDIISEDAFFQWEKSEEEPEGKGAALKQAVQFFTWLKEAEEES